MEIEKPKKTKSAVKSFVERLGLKAKSAKLSLEEKAYSLSKPARKAAAYEKELKSRLENSAKLNKQEAANKLAEHKQEQGNILGEKFGIKRAAIEVQKQALKENDKQRKLDKKFNKNVKQNPLRGGTAQYSDFQPDEINNGKSFTKKVEQQQTPSGSDVSMLKH